MEKNVGGMDKNIRLIVGIILLLVGFFTTYWLTFVGIVLVGTSLLNFCPLYLPLKINTNKKEAK